MNSSSSATFLIHIRLRARTVVDPIPLNIHLPSTSTNAHIRVHTQSLCDNTQRLQTAAFHLTGGGVLDHWIRTFSWWWGGLTFFPLSLPPPPALPEVRPNSPGTCLTWRWGQGVISTHKEDPGSSWKSAQSKTRMPKERLPPPSAHHRWGGSGSLFLFHLILL